QPQAAATYPQPQSARASSLVSVDSLSSLFVATGDARIAHLGEGGFWLPFCGVAGEQRSPLQIDAQPSFVVRQVPASFPLNQKQIVNYFAKGIDFNTILVYDCIWETLHDFAVSCVS
ncbi:MAG: hypothetical protein IJX84_04450, partial [Clostridia bacterium]|nr:hypothetical protein [Clostridia bacterium]